MKTVYVCKDSFENILCAVYDAWLEREEVRLVMEGERNLELFCIYIEEETDEEKALKVSRSIKNQISDEVWSLAYKASLSCDPDRADKIFRFLKLAFRYGPKITDQMALPEVFDIFAVCRFVDNETHLITQFTRFSQMEGGILAGRIGPKNDITVLAAPYFADRLPEENWILYDEKHRKAAVHRGGAGWILVREDSDEWEKRLGKHTDEEEYRDLWRVFHESISIKERENPVCQRGHLPLRYRPYMTEFQNKG